MKIRHKIFLSYLIVISVLIFGSTFAYYVANQVDGFRRHVAATDHQILAMTEIRLKVRNLLIEALQSAFADNWSNGPLAIQKARAEVEESFKNYDKMINLDSLIPERDLNRNVIRQHTDLTRLHESYERIVKSLDTFAGQIDHGEFESAKETFRNTREMQFKKEFLSMLGSFIEAEKREFKSTNEKLEQLSTQLKQILLLSTLLAIILTLILNRIFTITFNARIREIENAIAKFAIGTFGAEIPVRNNDELSLLAGTFNTMSKSLFEATTKLEQQQRSLMTYSKMSALGEMAGGIAHEINNPLAIIQGKSNQIRRHLVQGKIDHEKISLDLIKIENTTERIAKIIKGLKSFSRNAELDPMETIELSTVIQETAVLCDERFRNRNTHLRINCPTDLKLQCRPAQISQVLLNLLNNSYDAVSDLDQKWVAIDVEIKDAKIMISVMDSGAGIGKDVVDKLMQPFFTTKEVGKGTGLGLSISHGIIHDHLGKLYYDSDSKNTKFVIELPYRPADEIKQSA